MQGCQTLPYMVGGCRFSFKTCLESDPVWLEWKSTPRQEGLMPLNCCLRMFCLCPNCFFLLRKVITNSYIPGSKGTSVFQGWTWEQKTDMIYHANVMFNETESSLLQLPQSCSDEKLDMEKSTRPLSIHWNTKSTGTLFFFAHHTLPVSSITFTY